MIICHILPGKTVFAIYRRFWTQYIAIYSYISWYLATSIYRDITWDIAIYIDISQNIAIFPNTNSQNYWSYNLLSNKWGFKSRKNSQIRPFSIFKYQHFANYAKSDILLRCWVILSRTSSKLRNPAFMKLWNSYLWIFTSSLGVSEQVLKLLSFKSQIIA